MKTIALDAAPRILGALLIGGREYPVRETTFGEAREARRLSEAGTLGEEWLIATITRRVDGLTAEALDALGVGALGKISEALKEMDSTAESTPDPT